MAVELRFQPSRMEREDLESQRIRIAYSWRTHERARDDADGIEGEIEIPAIVNRDDSSTSTLSVMIYPTERHDRVGAQNTAI